MRIAVFEPHPDLSTNPVLVGLVRALAADGFEVDIYAPTHGHFLPLETIPNVKTHYYYYMMPMFRGFSPLALKYAQYHLRCNLRHLPQRLRAVVRFKQERPALLLAIDPQGVIEAAKFARRYRLPLVYFAFEIFFMDEMRFPDEVAIKKREIAASREAALLIVSDQLRGEALRKENSLSDPRMFYLPVAPSASPEVERNNYLREKYGIPDDKTIVIHAGSFSEWTCASELLESIENWPDDFVLVVHTRHRPDEFIDKAMRGINPEKVIFSTEPTSDHDYQKILASADVGLVLYEPIYSDPCVGQNIETIGLSSGKFSYYMKCGLPTIWLRQPSISALLPGYRPGLGISDFRELPGALKEIKQHYADFSSEAVRVFRERLDFDIHYPRLKEELLRLIPQPEKAGRNK